MTASQPISTQLPTSIPTKQASTANVQSSHNDFLNSPKQCTKPSESTSEGQNREECTPKKIAHIISGSICSSFASIALPYPLDVIRTRQQTNVTTNHRIIRSAIELIQRNGVKSLYKGLTTVMIFDLPATCVYYYTYTSIKHWLDTSVSFVTITDPKYETFRDASAGFIAVCAGLILWTPQDNIVQRTQVTSFYNTPRRIAQSILIREGFIGFWKGYLASVICWGPLCAIFFSSYEGCKRFYRYNYNLSKKDETAACITVSSIFAGILSIWLTQPLDVLRCQFQAHGTRGLCFEHVQNDSIWRTAMNMFRTQSLNKLMFQGFKARLLSTGPDIVLGILSFETLLKFLSGTYL